MAGPRILRDKQSGQHWVQLPGGRWEQVTPQGAATIQTLGQTGAAVAGGLAGTATGTAGLAAKGLEVLSPPGSQQETGARTAAEGLAQITDSLKGLTAGSPGAALGAEAAGTIAQLGAGGMGTRVARAIAGQGAQRRAARQAQNLNQGAIDAEQQLTGGAGARPPDAVPVRPGEQGAPGAQASTLAEADNVEAGLRVSADHANTVGGGGRVTTPYGGEMSALAAKHGWKISPAQRTGRRSFQRIAEAGETFALGKQAKELRDEANLNSLSGSVVKMLGGVGDEVTPQVLQEGYEHIDGLFKAAVKQDHPGIPASWVRQIGKGMEGRAIPETRDTIKKWVDEIAQSVDGRSTLTPASYSVLRGKLNKATSFHAGQAGQGRAVIDDLFNMMDELDQAALEAGILDPAAKVKADNAFIVHRALEKGRGTAVGPQGNINIRTLWGNIISGSRANKDRLRSTMDRTIGGTVQAMDPVAREVFEKMQLARYYQDLLKSSGTAERLGVLGRQAILPSAGVAVGDALLD